MTNAAAPVLLMGCGKMGGALLKGWTEAGLPADRIAVVEPDAASRDNAAKRFGVAAFADAAEIPARFHPHSVVIAVKPQLILKVLPAYGRFAGGDTVFLSIAAGTRIAALKKALGGGNVVRAMPNLPASIGCGISVACADTSVAPEARSRCEALLAAVGEVAWIDDEMLMDAVTAVSGSGRRLYEEPDGLLSLTPLRLCADNGWSLSHCLNLPTCPSEGLWYRSCH